MSMSYIGFGFLSVAVLSLGGLNAYQHTSSKRIEFLMECERERSRINDRVHGLMPDLRWIAVFCAASARTSRPGTALRNIGGIVISGSSRL